ncbi:acyltransferase [Pseudarthrobacter raffinosi]|uniref:acyltransferase n=1 Tax=Pseudarthrobacter raffinosi TaxID=2953651 RepID=UPI00208E334A|nr:acyltransferase [Pseudarthrobacter sp. MDT3-9]MCO4253151.1 acyltransferase [Pseudarthrobacter sp. MDT3-9]
MHSPLVIKQRIQSEYYAFVLRGQGAMLAPTARIIGKPIVQIEQMSKLVIGARVRLISDSRRTALGVNHPVVLRTLSPTAQLIISDDVGISGGSICAAHRVEIGAGTMLGANVTIADTDFHPVDHEWRRYQPTPPSDPKDMVLIGRNVFIGTGAVILKGTVLHDHCVVGAGSIVKGEFEAGTVLAGNPARAVRKLNLAPTG